MLSQRDREFLDWYHSQEGKIGLDKLENMKKLYLRGLYDLSNLREPENPVSSTYDHRNTKATRNKFIHMMLNVKIYYLIYILMHIIFDVIERSIQAYYLVISHALSTIYRDHRTPALINKDVSDLKKIPQHLSVILTVHTAENGLETLMDEVAELAAWSACAGITQLSVYERTGIVYSSHFPSPTNQFFRDSQVPHVDLTSNYQCQTRLLLSLSFSTTRSTALCTQSPYRGHRINK